MVCMVGLVDNMVAFSHTWDLNINTFCCCVWLIGFLHLPLSHDFTPMCSVSRSENQTLMHQVKLLYQLRSKVTPGPDAGELPDLLSHSSVCDGLCHICPGRGVPYCLPSASWLTHWLPHAACPETAHFNQGHKRSNSWVWNSGFLRALRGTEQSWNLQQPTDRFSTPGGRVKLCEVRNEHAETDRLQQKDTTLKIFLWISPLSLLVSPSAFSRPAFLHLSPSFLPSQGGSMDVNVTPVPMLLWGNWLLSLGAVGGHMLMFSYSREMRSGSHKER